MPSIWRRAAVYLGLVDDDEYDEYEPYEDSSRSARQGSSAASRDSNDEVTGGSVRPLAREPDGTQPGSRSAVVRQIAPIQSAKVHVVRPLIFDDAKEIGDTLKSSQPVIVNLQEADRDLCRRILDFSSGLAYAIGDIRRVADQVFLLTPKNVEVSAEEKRRLQERGLYQS